LSEDRVQLWIALCFMGGFCAYNWYWYIKSIFFYRNNGFDFSVNFGPDIWDDDSGLSMSPRSKFLFGWPTFVAVSSLLLIFIVLVLVGVLKPCAGCGS
jgi:hypothetical protein